MSRLGPLDWRSAYEGVVGTFRGGRIDARALAISDSRSLVRTLFLASAAQSALLTHLDRPRTLEKIAELAGVGRADRLRAWLEVGVELKELGRSGEVYRITGRRSAALASGDAFLVAHYRSMLEYQIGPYGVLDQLLGEAVGDGRSDLDRYANDIAEVSRAATPFVAAMVRRSVSEVAPARVLDVGCGSGIYTKIVLDSSESVHVDGVDLSPGVIEAARSDLAPFARRVDFHAADIREWLARTTDRFDLIMLANNIYYFDVDAREQLFGDLGGALSEKGQLLVVTMTTPGSIASAHLDFMLPRARRWCVLARTRRPAGRPHLGRLRHHRGTPTRAWRTVRRHSGPPNHLLAQLPAASPARSLISDLRTGGFALTPILQPQGTRYATPGAETAAMTRSQEQSTAMAFVEEGATVHNLTNRKSYADFLEVIPALSNCARSVLEDFVTHGVVKVYCSAGHTFSGDLRQDNNLYVLVAGSAALKADHEVTVDLEPGDYFGRTTARGHQLDCSVVAVDDIEVLVIDPLAVSRLSLESSRARHPSRMEWPKELATTARRNSRRTHRRLVLVAKGA